MWGVHTLVYGGISHPSGHLLRLPLVNSVLHIFVVIYMDMCFKDAINWISMCFIRVWALSSPEQCQSSTSLLILQALR